MNLMTGGGNVKNTTFPELRALMAKYGLTYSDLGKIIGNTYSTVSKKINKTFNFTLPDMNKIKIYFISRGEADVNISDLFFKWIVTDVTLLEG